MTPALRPEVDGRDLVVAATRRVGPHVLPVGGDDHDHDRDHGQADPRRDEERRHASDREGQQDLVGGVGHGRQRVRGEDRQRDALR